MMLARVLQTKDAMAYVGGEPNFRRLKHAGWIYAIRGKDHEMDFDIKVLDLGIDRANLDGWPPTPPKKVQT